MLEIVSIFNAIKTIAMTEDKDDKNPVIDTIHGIQIRESNTICLRVAGDMYRDLIEQSYRTSLSITKIIILRNEPCQSCGCDNVTLSLKKQKYPYKIGNTGGNLVKNQNGKGHDHPGEDNPS